MDVKREACEMQRALRSAHLAGVSLDTFCPPKPQAFSEAMRQASEGGSSVRVLHFAGHADLVGGQGIFLLDRTESVNAQAAALEPVSAQALRE
eukprot:2667026-Rhodomonas_salina.1